MKEEFFDQVYRVVSLIPPGRVATYGQIARILDMPRSARTVGWALRALPGGHDVPWHRVINAQGAISFSRDTSGAAIQRALLEAEGVLFDTQGRVDLNRYAWSGLDLAERDQLLGPAQDA